MGKHPGRSTIRTVLLYLALALMACGAAAPARAYTVRAQHPRIWLTPETLTRLRAQAAANSSRWQALKRLCDSSAAADWDIGVMDYALAYQVTGNTAYADKAITLMQGWMKGGTGAISDDSGYPARTILPGMAIGYDWCYDRLTAAQRTQFRTQMEAWADWVWPETNPSRSTGWSVTNPGDNYYHGFMMTWLVGLALAGDSPKANGYIDLALKKWHTVVRPYLDQFSAGGYALEGTTYGAGSLFRTFWYLAAHASATGEDLFNAPGVSWPRQAMLCKLYLTVPTRNRLYPGGDQARVSSAPLSDYDRSAGLVALNYLDKTTAGYARWWLDHIQPSRDEWKFTQWEELLWYREDVAATDYTQVLPVGYLAPGAGWMTSRSSWATDAVQVAMMCGPTREAHQDRAQNGFVIYCGNWLAAMARLTSHDGLFGEAQYHNTFTIGGEGQAWDPQSSRVAHFADTARYAYFAGDAPDAYENATQFRRELMFLKPNRILVFDRVNARSAGLVKKWHLQTLSSPTISGNTYQTTAGSSTLFGKALLPASASLAKVPMNLGGGGETTSWRIDEAAPTGQTLDHFLNVLEVAPASQAGATAASAIQTERSTLMGCQVGDQVVLFDVASTPTSVAYQTGAAAAREHFVLGQKPGQVYQVAETTLAGGALSQRVVQATDQGVVTFTTTGTGARRITVSTSTATPPPPPTPPANQAPVAKAGGPYTGTAGKPVTFSGAASTDADGTITAYSWSFGDAGTAAGATPSHTYAAAGTFTVTLKVTDDDGATASASATVKITAAEPPPAGPSTPPGDPPPTPTPVPPATSLSDDFNDNRMDPSKWTLGTIEGMIIAGPSAWDATIPVLEVNGRVEISPRARVSGNHHNGYVSVATWNLTNAAASVQVVQVAGGGTTDTRLALCIDPRNFCMIEVESGDLAFAQVVNGAISATSIPYSAAMHRFWRIRHDGVTDRMLFETSSDRVTWTTQRAVARQLPLTAIKVELSAGTWEPVGTPGTAIFEAFRLELNDAVTSPPANKPPVAKAGGPYTGTAGKPVTFSGAASTDADGTITAYSWSFGDAGTATGAAAAHTYAAAGTFTVTLKVTDDDGATASASASVKITAAEVPPAGPSTPPGGPSPTPVPLPTTKSLSDDFNDNRMDATKWTLGTIEGMIHGGPSAWDATIPVLEVNGRLEISPRARVSGDHHNGYVSVATWNLTNAAASVQVVQVAGGGTTDTRLALCIDPRNFCMIEVESGDLAFAQVVNGAISATSIPYSAALHRFWRIRHEGATDRMLFETSVDRVTWTTQRAVARQLPLTAMKVELSAGTWEPVRTPGTAIFENFRLEGTGP